MRNILFTVLFIGILSLIASPISLASKSLHKANMINLSNNAIICMHQDPDGYLWIGTYDGLNLYNGKDTYVYRFELNNKNSLCSNIIHKISDAEPGFLWISTSLGINKFSLKKRKVTESYPGYMESDLVATDSSGITLAICKENRISCYTPFSDGFRDLPREGIGPQTVRTLFAGTDGYFYLLLTSGILKKLTPDFSNTTFNLLSEERQFHNKPILSAFHENNHIFIVDTDNKLYRQQVDGSGKEFLFDLSGMTNKYGNIIKICTFQSNVYIVFRNGNILDLSQPENTIDTGIGIFCLMKDLGIWDGPVITPKEPVVSLGGEVGFVNAEKSGLFVPKVKHRNDIKKGEIIGEIVNPLEGTVEERLYAPCDGLIFTLRAYPMVERGSLIARILGGGGR